MTTEATPTLTPSQTYSHISDDDLHRLVSGDPSIYEAPAQPQSQPPVAPPGQIVPPQPAGPTSHPLQQSIQTEPTGVATNEPQTPKLVPVQFGREVVHLPEAEAAKIERERKHFQSIQSRLDSQALFVAAQPKTLPQPVQPQAQPAQIGQTSTQDEIDLLFKQAETLDMAGEYERARAIEREAIKKTRQQTLEVNAYMNQKVERMDQERQAERKIVQFQQAMAGEKAYIESDLSGSGVDPDAVWGRLSEWRGEALRRGYQPQDVFGPAWTNEWYAQIKQEFSPTPEPIRPQGSPQPQAAQPTLPTGNPAYRPVPGAVLSGGSASLRAAASDRAQFDQRGGGYRRTPPEGSLDRLLYPQS